MKSTQSSFFVRAPWVAGVVLLLALLFTSSRAGAAGSAFYDTDVVGGFYMTQVEQPPGVTWTFTTSALSGGSDTVIHVQDNNDPQGGFIAGNDDFNGLASRVVVSPAANWRTLRLVVRSYSQFSQGSCLFDGVPSSGSGAFSYTIGFGGTKIFGPTLAATAHVTTSELQGQATDLVLLAIGGIAEHAVAFDDDDGVGLMPWMHLPEVCTNCQFVLANYSAPGTLKTNLFYDEEADWVNPDGDGLGTPLESFLGTDPFETDSDQDGISDDYEVYGKDSTALNPVKFPTWGADPLLKDLFVEVDWQQCLGDSSTCPNGIDTGQLTPEHVAQVKSDFWPVRVHFDIGTFNTDPETWFDWGSWGGATRMETSYGPDDISGQEGESEERQYLFHHGFSFPFYTGHSWWVPGPYFTTTNAGFPSGRVTSHELGHNLGLHHGGRPFTLGYNYKTNYFSIMNYRSEFTAPFSHGLLPSLNPTALDEQLGIGTTSANALAGISTWYAVNPTTGAIDWNRDGAFAPSSTMVQGPVALDDFSLIGQTVWRVDPMTQIKKLRDASMSWVSIGGVVGDQLWMFGRGNSGQLQYSRAARTQLDAGCGSITSLDEWSENCAGMTDAVTDVPGTNKVLSFGPGVAELNATLLVVTQPTSGTLISNQISINGGNGQITYGNNVTLPGGVTASGDVAALSTGIGVVKAWAPSGGRLKQWTYQNNAWSNPVDQRWSDNSLINPKFGIAVVRGFQDGSSTARIYAAIPTSPNGVVEFARQDATTGRWSKLNAWQQMAQPLVTARPGLAYQRRAGQGIEIGRFYMALNLGPISSLILTEGNLASGSTRRLRWIGPGYTLRGPTQGGINLVNDTARDLNLRAMETYTDGTTVFMALADGIPNGNVSDNDDYLYLLGALRASLWQENLPLP